jgi:hypothetical protein
MCSTGRETLIKKTRREKQIKSYEAMAVVPTLTDTSQIWTITKESRMQKFKLQK